MTQKIRKSTVACPNSCSEGRKEMKLSRREHDVYNQNIIHACFQPQCTSNAISHILTSSHACQHERVPNAHIRAHVSYFPYSARLVCERITVSLNRVSHCSRCDSRAGLKSFSARVVFQGLLLHDTMRITQLQPVFTRR